MFISSSDSDFLMKLNYKKNYVYILLKTYLKKKESNLLFDRNGLSIEHE